MYATDLMGLTLDNPVVIAPGPWSRGEKLKDALQCNAGAIITESIVSESYADTSPRYTYSSDNRGTSEYTALQRRGARRMDPLAGSEAQEAEPLRFFLSTDRIHHGYSPSELGYMAKKIEKTGIDGIEIGFACPMGEGQDIIAGDPSGSMHVPVKWYGRPRAGIG